MLSEFDRVLETPSLRPALDNMVKRDVEADLQEIQRSLPPSPVSWEATSMTFTQSQRFHAQGTIVTAAEPGIWQIQ